MGYIGYFRSLHNNILYSVSIYRDNNEDLKEITLKGENPFVVKYSDSRTIFEPIRTSTATIGIISDNYFEDILPSKAQETKVVLKNENTGEKIWLGYLTPKVYSQGYEECIEEIELEAADVLSSTQYIDYKYEGSRSLVTFRDIIKTAFQNTDIEGFYWPKTKKTNGNIIYPEKLKISEMNFYTSDTDEAWDVQTILEEMCKYLGLTCIQYQSNIYFMDYTALGKNIDRFQFTYYPKGSDYNQTSSKYSGSKITINAHDVMGNGETISFEPIYNKIIVKDNFYTCEDFITNIFADEHLTNRNGDFYSSFKIFVPPYHPFTGERLPVKPSYPSKTSGLAQKYVEDGSDGDTEFGDWTGDRVYSYFHRLYDHKDYESVYRDINLNEVNPDNLNDELVTQKYVGATIVDLGRVKNKYTNDAGQPVVSNKIDWQRYLCICQLCKGWGESYNGYLPNGDLSGKDRYKGRIPTNPEDNMVVFRLKPGSTGQVMMNGSNSYLIINYGLIFEKYIFRNYINPDWTTELTKKSFWTEGEKDLHKAGMLAFRLGIGGKFWNGHNWEADSSRFFKIPCELDENKAFINTEKKVLNRIEYNLNINEEGYLIPLEGVDTAGELVFEIFLPKIQLITDYDYNDKNNIPYQTYYNGYCWVKDFTIKTATIGQDVEVEDSDVVYENVIDEFNINEMDEIEVKFTTQTQNTKPSYSNVIYWDGNENSFLTKISEDTLNDKEMKAEENIIQRYYQQYSTPTKKLSYTFGIEHTPFDKYFGMDIENPNTGYVQCGVEIDYSRDTQIMTLVEKK